MTNSVEAMLTIELNVECPSCLDFFDLMKHENLNEEGSITEAACPSGSWHEAHQKFELETKCPTCKQPVKIEGIGW
jgi:ssDNA-binding Zn-finger/Zn-ribbon topoisomerase 1